MTRFKNIVFILACLLIIACGGGGTGLGQAGPGQAFDEETGAPILPLGALTLVGGSPSAMNPVNLPVKLRLSQGDFVSSKQEFKLVVNGVPVSGAALNITKSEVSTTLTLADGKNTISFEGHDQQNRALHLNETLWAGSQTLVVELVDPQGQPITSSATVTLRLTDESTVVQQKTTTTGTATFTNVPARTVVAEAKVGTTGYGVVGGGGNAGTLTLQVNQLGGASAISNNDFSKGLDGWTVDNGAGSVVDHIEDLPPSFGRPSRGGDPLPRNTVGAQRPIWMRQPTSDNRDLVLTTLDEGPQNATRTFQTTPGTNSVTVRYRFITSEVPGGYFGSQYNDYFQVSLRSSSEQNGESNSMNGLGLAAFDYNSGATPWRTVTLKVKPTGDTVRFDAQVANVGDGAFDSQVVIDYLSEQTDAVTPTLTWSPQSGGLQLTYTVEQVLQNDVSINIFWASGSNFASKIGGAFFTHVVPSGTGPGSYGPTFIQGSVLASDPAGTQFILAAVGEARVSALADVKAPPGPEANINVVSATMMDIIKDGLRQAGQASATITSTARTPFAQARAMFNNLVLLPGPISANIAKEKELYAPPGDIVVGVFETAANGLTRDQIVSQASAIRALMEAKIIALGPSTVSKHCADPAVISVVDIGKSAFATHGNGPRFLQAVTGRLSRAPLDEIKNNAYHLERD